MKENFGVGFFKKLSKNTANINLGKNVNNIKLNLNPVLKKNKIGELNKFEFKLKNLNKTDSSPVILEELDRIKILKKKTYF